MRSFREYLQSKQQQFMEVVQTVGSGTINYFAKNILDDLQKPDIRVGRIKGWIYAMLTRTPEISDNMIPPGYAEKFMVSLPKIPVPSHTKVRERGGFVHFTTVTDKPNRQRIGDQNEARVTLKQYFSLNTDVQKLKETLNYLFRTVPVLAVEIHKIAVKNNDQINFKIPDQLWMFMEHPDTIVVHYYNESSGPEIRQVVDRLFPDQADRGLRVKSGFDIKHPSLQNSRIEAGGSHSELIAWAVAGTIMQAKDKVLSKYDANSFGQKLLEVIKIYGEMNQRNLYAAYLKTQKLETPANNVQKRNSLQVMNDLIAAFKIGKVNKTQANQEIDRLVDENPDLDRSAFVNYINGVLGSPIVV
jgi:hypothetical protein